MFATNTKALHEVREAAVQRCNRLINNASLADMEITAT